MSDKSETKDKGQSDNTFFGVDLTPVLPVALSVSTVIGMEKSAHEVNGWSGRI